MAVERAEEVSDKERYCKSITPIDELATIPLVTVILIN